MNLTETKMRAYLNDNFDEIGENLATANRLVLLMTDYQGAVDALEATSIALAKLIPVTYYLNSLTHEDNLEWTKTSGQIFNLVNDLNKKSMQAVLLSTADTSDVVPS